MTKVVTFYSFKGGVGRTMALVNVAHVLARSGLRVLIVDFDLEAPGMTHFFADLVRKQKLSLGSKDAVDLLLDAKTAMRDPEGVSNIQLDSITEYVVQLPVPRAPGGEFSRVEYLSGRLDFMPATLEAVELRTGATHRSDYLDKINALDLPGIFSTAGPRHLFGQFVKNYFLSARFESRADEILNMRKTVSARYDIVLIDSRTGLGEISGLCVGPLSDAVVVFTGLNEQNIAGTKYFMDKSGLLGPDGKPHLVVVGPVPPWHTTDSSQRKRKLIADLRAITGELVEVPYHPLAAIGEPIFVQVEPEDPIALAYEELAPKVVAVSGFFEPLRTLKRFARHEGVREKWPFLTRIAESLHVARAVENREFVGLLRYLYSFPSAAGVAALLRIKWRSESEGIDSLAIAGGIGAYFRNDPRVFDRAWSLSDSLEARMKRRAQSQLVYLQYRLFGSFARRPDPLRQARAAYEAVLTGETLPEGSFEIFDAIISVAASAIDREENLDARRRLVLTLARNFDRQPYPFFKRALILRGAESVAATDFVRLLLEVNTHSTKKISQGSIGAVRGLRLPKETRKSLASRLATGEPVGEYLGSLGGMWAAEPGSRPNLFDQLSPLMMSALAMTEGAEAIDEILFWLDIARSAFGYGWRALMNWKQLERLSDVPEWNRAIREEEMLVHQVESEIDRGRFAL
jgi:MinD-like ATPase involved in chromosome partitioning or flagellar assembly